MSYDNNEENNERNDYYNDERSYVIDDNLIYRDNNEQYKFFSSVNFENDDFFDDDDENDLKRYYSDGDKFNEGAEISEKLQETKPKNNKNIKKRLNSHYKTYFTTNKIKKGLIYRIEKKSKKNNLGRKKKNEKSEKRVEVGHDKFSYDNLTRKLKVKLFEAILFIINSSIKDSHIKIGNKNVFSKNNILLKLENEVVINTNVIFNKDLLKSQLKDIFSNNISLKYLNYGLDYNKKLIQKIYNENIHKKTIAILDRTLQECLEHFRGSKYYKELAGLEKEYEKIIKGLEDSGQTEEYVYLFKDLINYFEVHYDRKRARKRKKN